MAPEKKSNILKYSGIAVMVFAMFTFVSVLSYLFTWSTDQSLMSHPEMMDKGVEVANWAGKAGYKWASFLVSDCFGLGSFAMIFLLFACAYRLFCWDRSIGLLRLTFLSVSGTFLASLILAYSSMAVSNDIMFGGGLGGDAGHAVILWMENIMGAFVSALILLALVVAWLLAASGRFAAWFAELGKRKEPKIVEPETPEEQEVDDELDEEVDPVPVP
jgi:S-DNA-T family DNA segregation ATPase FtsK/SpoIIIE